MMPVTMAKAGEKNYIAKITGKDDVRAHLAALGFVVGESVTVVSSIGGNVILSIKDSRIALGRELAQRILI
jgi:Fe2+ transport system protein A